MSPGTPPLLTYAPSPEVGPLFTSDPQGQLTITAGAPPGTTVYCSRILIAIPTGPGAASVFSAPPTSSVGTNVWTPTSAPCRSSDPYSNQNTTTDYTATVAYDLTADTRQPFGGGLVLGLQGAVNDTAGDATILIRETSGTTPDPATFTTKETQIMVRKTPADFYLRNFIATKPDSPTTPCTDFDKDKPIRLSWESNGTNFQLTLPGQTTPTDLGSATDYTIPATKLTRDTTLVLTATLTDASGTATRLYDKLTITITNPDLTPTSVGVASTLYVKGSTTLAAATTATLTATGTVQVGSLTSAGTVDASSLTTSGATIKGNLAADDLTAKTSATLANLTANGSTAVTGPVSLFGQPEVIYSGGDSGGEVQVTKTTDGIIVMTFWVAQPKRDGATFGVSVKVAGREFMLGDPDSPNTISIPVAAGVQWSYLVIISGFDYKLPPSILWYPLGRNQK
ncbi:hypothetical protein [Streptomyces tsukubensis]|uniref:hypothetical protein n=1 Tax=Streptomyces tsukubensis TaxID=83656 RepID=UPI00344DBEDA